MARGVMKQQAQQKNKKKQEALKKSEGSDVKAAAQKALIFKCPVSSSKLSWRTLVDLLLAYATAATK